jgi:hypothetical protein
VTIGQLITSFLQGKVNPTTTSTIFSPYVDHVMEESKTEYFKGLAGATPASNRGSGLSVAYGHLDRGTPNKDGRGRVSILRSLNDLLPYSMRPIKSRRRLRRVEYTVRAELYWMRRVWHSHKRPALVKAIKKLQFWKRG